MLTSSQKLPFDKQCGTALLITSQKMANRVYNYLASIFVEPLVNERFDRVS
jgi:hypothetical protein